MSIIEWLRQKLILVKLMFQLIDIEPFVFFYVMSLHGSEVTRTQMIQDKLCINKYNQSRQFCIELGKIKSDENEYDHDNEVANQILGEVSQYLTYTLLISSLPGLLYVIFIASWIDSYIHGRKIVLCMGALGHIGWHALLILNSYEFVWDVKYVLLAYIPPTLVGGWSCAWMTVYSFMTNNSSKEYRFIKFTSFELASFISRPLSIYIGGLLIGRGNYNSGANIHNYGSVFIFCLCSAIIAFVYCLVGINENKQNIINKKDINENQTEKQIQCSDKMSHKFEFSKMFDMKNLSHILKTAFKERPEKGRAKIWLLYGSMCVLLLTDAKFFSVLFPYAEKIYGWNANVFSNIKSLSSIVQTIAMPVASAIFSAYLKLGDIKIAIIGLIQISLEDICIGSIIEPLGLYLLFIIGSTTSLSSLAIRSLLSKIAPESESGKIFALLGALELIFTAIEAIVLNSIFKFSIDFFPSLLFQMAAALNFIPIFIFFWFDFNHNNNNEINATKL